MKVAFLCGYPFVPQRFGVAEHVGQLSRALAEHQDCACHIVCMHAESSHRQVQPNTWLHSLKLRPAHFIFPSLACHLLCKTVSAIHPDVIHLHGSSLPYAWVALKMRREFPLVTTFHGDAIEEGRYKPWASKLWAKYVTAYLIRRLCRVSDGVIVCSSAMKAGISGYRDGRAWGIPNGICLEDFSVKREFEPFTYILYLGALQKIKGVDLLLQALPGIFQATGEKSVVIAGSGPELSTLRRMASELNVASVVDFPGYVTGSEKSKLLRDAGALIVPSRYEAFSIVILEALASGIPVLASNVGGVPGLIRNDDNGLLFTKGNLDELTSTMIALIRDASIRERIGLAGRKSVGAYTWKNIARQTREVYEACRRT
jgi:glycosyltransferase involved in cell wall biosynthesis